MESLGKSEIEAQVEQAGADLLEEQTVEEEDGVPVRVVVQSPLVLPGTLVQDHWLSLMAGL